MSDAERLGGIQMLLAYSLDGLYQVINGRDPYADNSFEVRAGIAQRGGDPGPPMTLGEAVGQLIGPGLRNPVVIGPVPGL